MVRVNRARTALVIMLSGFSLSACVHGPLPYSPNYSRITLVDEAEEVVKAQTINKAPQASSVATVPRVQKIRNVRTVDLPDACVTPDVAAQPLYLPPGCANNLNLQMMVEWPRDLVRGRHPGPAAAAPVVRAAQRYLYGGTEAERRAARLERPQDQPATPSPSLPQGSRTDAR